MNKEVDGAGSAAELIKVCGSADDQSNWIEFVRHFHRRILAYILRERRAFGMQTDEANAVSDLSQEVYVRLLANDRRALKEFQGTTDIAAYAYIGCIVRSVVSDHLRRESRQKRSVPLVSLDEELEREGLSLAYLLKAGDETLPDEMTDEKHLPQRLRGLLSRALEGKNAVRDSLIFQMHVLNGLTAREIADLPTLNITQANVEIIIRRTREKLRELLKNSGDMSV